MNDPQSESTNPDEVSSEESSQDVTPESQSGSTPQEPETKKPRSPVERAIVWGGIAVLLVVVIVEAKARQGYDHALNEITARISEVEDTDGAVNEAIVAEVFGGRKPASSGQAHNTSSGAKRVDIYRWDSLFKARALYVYYGLGDSPEVLAVTTQPDIDDIPVEPILEQIPPVELAPEKQPATEETQTPAETENPDPAESTPKKE